MIQLWQHILVVLALLTSNAVTFFVCKRRIEVLQGALVARRVLLGDVPEARSAKYVIELDGTLSLRDGKGGRMDIIAREQRAYLEIIVV